MPNAKDSAVPITATGGTTANAMNTAGGPTQNPKVFDGGVIGTKLAHDGRVAEMKNVFKDRNFHLRAWSWLDPYNMRRVGTSIRLYYIPPCGR